MIFFCTVSLLDKYYYKNSNIEDVDQNVMKTFLDTTLNFKYNSFFELYQDIEEFSVKVKIVNRKCRYQEEKKDCRIYLYKYHKVSKK